MSNHEWHVALNVYNQVGGDFRHWMYEAKTASSEIDRLKLLFKREREGGLPKVHRQCSFSEEEKVEDNHLTCCIGTECRQCPHLLALETKGLTGPDLDNAKAWTCVSHIMHTIGSGVSLDTSEGYILTTDDRMFWQNVYQSMSNFEPSEKAEAAND